MNRYETDTLRYYNASFTNITPDGQLASLVDARTSPILENPSDWLMSVVRFDVDIRAIPINIPLLLNPNAVFPPPSAPFPYPSSSYITLQYHGVNHTQNVIYIETDPTAPFQTIYNYQVWLDYVNTALAAAFATIVLVPQSPTSSPPRFIYNPNTELIDLYIDANYLPSAGVDQITIFMNVDLYLYFTNFQFDDHTSTNPFNHFKLIITNTNTNLLPIVGSRQNLPIAIQTLGIVIAAPPSQNGYVCQQTAPGIGGWTSLRSLLLTSSLLPCRNEAVPSNSTNFSNYNSQGVFPILTDFLVPIDRNVADNRIVGEYLPTAQYRYIDLISNVALKTIDFTFYWTDFLGNRYPLYLNTNTGMNIKVLFQRKNILHEK